MTHTPRSPGPSDPGEGGDQDSFPQEQEQYPNEADQAQTSELSAADLGALRGRRGGSSSGDSSSPPNNPMAQHRAPEERVRFLHARVGHQGRYYLESLLGKGGMGEVYRAFDIHLGRIVALKIMTMPAQGQHSHDLLKRFEQEISISARFNSPHIVQVTDLGLTEDGYPYYVMEYLQGETLRTLLKREAYLSLERVVTIVIQLCEGLDYAHQYGVVHRDLKPENIFLSPGPLGDLVKIIDFGIAKIIRSNRDSQTTLTQVGSFLGTLQYAAPEQCEGNDVDRRTDIYSLGVLSYELLSGTNPFGLDREAAISAYRWMDCHVTRTPIPLQDQPHCGNVPPPIIAAIQKCMEKSPANRFASAGELRDILKASLSLNQGLGTKHEVSVSGQDEILTIPKPADPSNLNQFKEEILLYPSGPIPVGASVYVPLPIEDQIYKELHRSGSLVRIKAPKEMGKTSLLLRILDYAQGLGYAVVSLSLDQVDQTILGDLNRLLRWLCISVARQLEFSPQLDHYWDEEIGNKVSCTQYFRGYILKQLDVPLLIAFDEINQIFEFPQVAKDFLPLLRFWFEESKRQPAWQKLRMVVVHSTEIYVPLQLKQSPFNVGTPIQLEGFSLEQIKQLAYCYHLVEQENELERLMALVGGHPALVHLAIYHLKHKGISTDQLLETAPTLSGIFGYHLQRHLVVVQEQPELVEALQQVMNSSEPVSLKSTTAHKLSSMGLVSQLGNTVVPGCELYRLFFSRNLD